MLCLYNTCKKDSMECDVYCDQHRQQYGLYMPQTYVQAYNKAKAMYEKTGDQYFVYRHIHVNHCHKGYGTAKVTHRNWIHAMFSEVLFPQEGIASTNLAQTTMFALRGK